MAQRDSDLRIAADILQNIIFIFSNPKSVRVAAYCLFVIGSRKFGRRRAETRVEPKYCSGTKLRADQIEIKMVRACCSQKASLVTMIGLTTAFFFAEIVVGYATNSMALVADSFHMLSDVVSLFVGFFALKVSLFIGTPLIPTFSLHFLSRHYQLFRKLPLRRRKTTFTLYPHNERVVIVPKYLSRGVIGVSLYPKSEQDF